MNMGMSDLSTINWALIAPIIVIQFVLMIVALIDLSKVYATNGSKKLWVLIILIGGIIGPIAYFIFGRRNV